uniref:Uncharacterized protein n=1 Tax=Callorhinchus milii TaxID=7868 RepID=A0A4W3GEI2_CALMI
MSIIVFFFQMFEGLKPSDKYEKPLDYRWPARYDQWWECKFISEGIIDQGKLIVCELVILY